MCEKERESEMRVKSGQGRCFYSEGGGASFDAGTTGDEGNLQAFAESLHPLGRHEFTHADPLLEPKHQHITALNENTPKFISDLIQFHFLTNYLITFMD